VDGSKLVLGKHSGRNALRHRLSEMGITCPDDDLQKIYNDFIKLADAKKTVADSEILAIAQKVILKSSRAEQKYLHEVRA
jgi:2-isopropylmalate synthase